VAPFAGTDGSATQAPDALRSFYAKDHLVRDFRDAKAIAKTLREALHKSVTFTNSESRERIEEKRPVANVTAA